MEILELENITKIRNSLAGDDKESVKLKVQQ